MEQKIFNNKADSFDTSDLKSEFDTLFDTEDIVYKRRYEQIDNKNNNPSFPEIPSY